MALAFSLFSLILFATLHPQILQLQAQQAPDLDFSYMKVVKNATDFPASETYDYIIVGGGTAGCPLAATLSHSHSVLVLERGGAPSSHPNVLTLNGFFANLMQEDDGASTPAQRFTSGDGVPNVRGRVLGGSSMVNAGFFSRAEQDFFSSGKWDDVAVEEAYQWVEETVMTRPRLTAWQTAVKDALLSTGVVPDNGFDLEHLVGTKVSGSTFDGSGRRHGAVELLNKGRFENLRIAVGATVERIVFSGEGSKPTATGVKYTDAKGKSHTAYVRKNGEIIISAGALGSPQLLLLSGIGPKSYLTSQNIPVILANPDVGKQMADNPRNNLNLVLPFPTESSSVQVVGIAREYYIESVSAQLPFSASPFPFSFYMPGSSMNIDVTTIGEKLSHPTSRGSLRLASPVDAKVAPRVKFNYFATATDLAMCMKAMRNVGDMLRTSAMEQFKYTDGDGVRGFRFFGAALPGNYSSDDVAMGEFCRSTVTTIWHYHGGCLVGKVVDEDYRVIGVESLRVLDGSTFKESPGTNPQATLMMLGRYVGLKMLRERGAH